MELNSIFLHSRSLLNLYRQPKESISFRFVALVNIVTFFIFRMAISAYLIYWLIWSIFFAVGDDELGWYMLIFNVENGLKSIFEAKISPSSNF